MSDALEGYLRKAGGRGSSFPPIVAAGPRSALPHAPPTMQALGASELLLIDWGASGRFYKSDLTRVLDTRRKGRIPGNGAKLEEVHEIVLRAQTAAIRTLRPGITGHDVDAAARQVIAEAGSSVYGPLARLGRAHALAAQGKADEAIALLSELSADRTSPLPVDGVLIQLARTSARAGKTDDARAAFRRIVDEFPTSSYVAEARRELARMG